jgi:hypothetical protein
MRTVQISTALARCSLLLSLLGASGCDRMLTRPLQYGDVAVSVTQRNGDPIPGVGLQLYIGARPMDYGVTGADGKFKFERVPTGDYGVTAVSLPAGYIPLNQFFGGPRSDYVDGLAVAPETTTPAHLVFLKLGRGTIVARVTGVAGVPMAGLMVQLYTFQGPVTNANTDSNGQVTFDAVPMGNYGIIVFRPLQYQGFYYRDFVVPRDSTYSYRDGLFVDDGTRDSVAVSLSACSGSLQISVSDQTGAPDSAAVATIRTENQVLATLRPANGSTVSAPCADTLTVSVDPGQGYSVAPGSGSSFIDGITLKSGQTAAVAFHVQRNP